MYSRRKEKFRRWKNNKKHNHSRTAIKSSSSPHLIKQNYLFILFIWIVVEDGDGGGGLRYGDGSGYIGWFHYTAQGLHSLKFINIHIEGYKKHRSIEVRAAWVIRLGLGWWIGGIESRCWGSSVWRLFVYFVRVNVYVYFVLKLEIITKMESGLSEGKSGWKLEGMKSNRHKNRLKTG